MPIFLEGFVVSAVLAPLYTGAHQVVAQVDRSLRKHSPLALMAGTAITLYTIHKLGQSLSRQKLASWALAIPAIRSKYDEQIQKAYLEFRAKVLKSWGKLSLPIMEGSVHIPELGKGYSDLVDILEAYRNIVLKGIKEQHLSGTIYSNSLNKDLPPLPRELPPHGDKIKAITTLAYQEAQSWNRLHAKEFAVGPYFEFIAVQMLSTLYGGSRNQSMGAVTSGGTESLMMAALAYRNWGQKVKEHAVNESVILAPDTFHAALDKAGTAYNIKIIRIPTGETGELNVEAMNKALQEYGDQVVALFLSAPNYPTGKNDPIQSLVQKGNFGIHIDCCLGGFLNQGPDANFLTMPGVTSLSADYHKNGMMPAKGASGLVTQNMPNGENLFHYAIFAIPGWKGGIYGSPKNAGSESCVAAFTSVFTMLALGKKGYQDNSQKIQQQTQALADAVCELDPLRLIVSPDLNVVTFKIDEKHGFDVGATYEFAHEMDNRKFTLNTIQGDAVHYCITARDANDPKFIHDFKKAAQESFAAVKATQTSIRLTGKKFSGEAGMYCELEAALKPNIQEQSFLKYIENWLLGAEAADDVVRRHFEALSNPYATSRLVEER